MTVASRLLVAVALAATAAAAGSRPPAPHAARASVPAGAPRDAAAATEPRAVGPTGIVLPAADPMAVEMQREIERSQREYAVLFQRLSLAHAESEALGIEEEMRQERVGLQIGLLRIQAAYARRAGRNTVADRLELAIAALVAADPPPPVAPDGQHRL